MWRYNVHRYQCRSHPILPAVAVVYGRVVSLGGEIKEQVMDMRDIMRRAEDEITRVSNDPSIDQHEKSRLIHNELYEVRERQRECDDFWKDV